MKTIRHGLSGLLIIIVTCVAFPQTQHIHVDYQKDTKQTKVETNFLYLGDTPDQFLEIQLTGFFKGQTLENAPKSINVAVISVTKHGLYRNNHDVAAVADGEELKLGAPDYLALRGETKSGKEAFFANEKSGVGMQIPVPQSAKVRQNGSIDGLSAEWMNLSVKLTDLSKLAAAKSVTLQIGKSDPISLGEIPMTRLGEFMTTLTQH